MKCTTIVATAMFSIFLLSSSIYASDDKVQSASHDQEGEKAGEHTDANVATLEDGRDALKAMQERYHAELPALTAEAIKDLMVGLDKGKLQSKLLNILTGNEAFTDVEKKAVFSSPKGNILDRLSPADSLTIAVEYTRARQQLRAELLKAIQMGLAKNPDLRTDALAKAVELATKGNLEAYDKAIKKLNDDFKAKPNERTRPICFTCGESLSDEPSDPKDPNGPNWEFFDKMHDAAHNALVAAKLDNDDSKGPFFNFHFGRTSDGKIVQVVMGVDGTMTARTSSSTPVEESKKLGQDPGLVAATHAKYKKWLENSKGAFPKEWTQVQKDTVTNFLKKNDPNNPANQPGAALASAVSLPSMAAKPVDNSVGPVQRYLSSLSATGGHPDPTKYADIAVMAGELDITGYISKRPQHWDGTSKFGVDINWLKLRGLLATQKPVDAEGKKTIVSKTPEELKADAAEYARVTAILRQVKFGSIDSYKVVNGQVGYCLWCNLRNDPEALTNLP